MDIKSLTDAQKEAIGLGRLKKKTVYDFESQVIDVQTGEIVRHESKEVAKTSSEPDFIKLYYKVMLAFSDIQNIPLEFIVAISNNISWANGGTKMIFSSSKLTKNNICAELGLKEGMYKRYLSRARESGILFPIDGYRGAYEVNPWLIAKGRWENIKLLQASFDFVDGKWTRAMADPPQIDELTPNEAALPTEEANDPDA